jgi:hypothetical protein
MKAWLKRGGLYFIISSVFLLSMMAFSFTPLAWYLEGHPSESYPELFFAFYGLPAAILSVIASLIYLSFTRKRR